jgi:hypothetical protein
MKKSIVSIVLLAAALSFSACSQKQSSEEEQKKEASAEGKFFGEKITADNAVSLPDFMKTLGDKDSVQVKISADIQECCQKKGCWMKVDKGDGSSMRVSFKDYAFFVPTNSAGKKAIMDGIAYYQVTSVDELKHYAHDAGKSKAEIDSIKEPKKELVFEAKGVIIQ